MRGQYYIHSPEHWNHEDLVELTNTLDKSYDQDVAAALGEGAGGAGFDTIVEFLLTNPIATSVLGAIVYDIAKKLMSNLPKKRPKVPEGVPAMYKLVVHTNDGIIVINLDGDIKDIEMAIKNMPDLAKEDKSRAYQNGKNWDVY